MVVFPAEYCCTAVKKKVPGYRANGSGFHHISLKSRRHPVSPWSSPRPWLRGRPRRRSPARCFLSRLSHWRRRRQRHSALPPLRTRAVGNSLGESWVRPNLDVIRAVKVGKLYWKYWKLIANCISWPSNHTWQKAFRSDNCLSAKQHERRLCLKAICKVPIATRGGVEQMDQGQVMRMWQVRGRLWIVHQHSLAEQTHHMSYAHQYCNAAWCGYLMLFDYTSRNVHV